MAHKTPFQAWSEYLSARLVATAIGSFELDTNLTTAMWAGGWVHRIDRKHRVRSSANIAACFPHWSAEQVDQTAEASIQHLLQLAFEVVQAPRLLHRDGWSHRLELKNLGPALTLLNAKQPVILVTGHIGNWEILGYLLATLGYRVDAIARPLDNPLLNDWLLGIREGKGLSIITKWDATDRMLDTLQRGGALGFIADQNAGEKGLFVPFFNRLASTYKSIGLLAMNQRVPIVCGYAHRIGPGFRYEVGVNDIITPEDWANQPDPLYYITARYCRAMEHMVRLRPAQYFWMHRRWKSRPRHEREHKPMPAALRKNLEALPWMTQHDIDQLKIAAPTR